MAIDFDLAVSDVRPTVPLPATLIESAKVSTKVEFDPQQHLAFEPPAKILSMQEIGLGNAGISPNAVSEPFGLFTVEAIKQMRAEIFSQPVVERFQCTSRFATHMIRGYCPEYGRFVRDAWHHPETLSIVSKIAGIDLVPAVDYDVGHVNISISSESATPFNSNASEDMAAFDWHFDSHPFVCVTMLSDCTGMVGGETALRTGCNDILKVRGPRMGNAVVMQGKYIEHQALKAHGGRERVSTVTSFRPKCPLAKDETVLLGVRGISDVPTLLTQYMGYRLENLGERVRDELRQLRKRAKAGETIDAQDIKVRLLEQKQYVESTIVELEGGNPP